MKNIESLFENIKLARKQVFQNLTIFPLLGPNGGEPNYLTLEQALEQNVVRITELDREGSVPELKLINSGEKNVLILEGEELVGAKQNRIVNSTFLIGGKTEVVIPVSCVEQGRWRYESNEFGTGKKMMHASLRRSHQEDVKFSLQSGRGYGSNQGRIWQDIAEKSTRMNVSTSTRAMGDMYESYETKLTEYLNHFQLIELQAGAVFAINGEVLGLECFGCHDTLKRFFDKIVKSYALDALDSIDPENEKSVPPEKARNFMASIRKSQVEKHPSLGLGKNVVIESRSVSGSGFIKDERVIHLSVFKKLPNKGRNSIGFQRYSSRLNRRI